MFLFIPDVQSFKLLYDLYIKDRSDIKERNKDKINAIHRILLPSSLNGKGNGIHGIGNLAKFAEIRYFNDSGIADDDIILIMDKYVLYKFKIIDNANVKIKSVSRGEKDAFVFILYILWQSISNNTNEDDSCSLKSKSMQKDFINICAHELRAPLHPIMLQAGLLLKKIKDSNEYRMVESIYSNATRMGRIIDDLLEMARIDSDLIVLKKEKFKLNDLMESLVLHYNRLILSNSSQGSNLKIEYNDGDVVFFIEADRDRIQQALVNIINNSLKFTKKGCISITLTLHKKNNVLIRISDTGIGIDEKIMPRLFTKFVTTSTKGLGLGLYISKNIVNSHQGEIWAENNKSGFPGSTFYIKLPTIIYKESSENLNLLIIDGDGDFISLLRAHLDKLGYRIDAISDLSKLKDSYIHGYYSMIIVDHSLEEDDESDTIKKIKLKEKVKVCYLTKGKTNYESFRILYGMGKDDLFISKTLKTIEIAERIDTYHKA